MSKKILFLSIWLISILFSLFAIRANFSFILPTNRYLVLINLLQRIFGVLIYVLTFWQIVLGVSMEWWTKKLGRWIFKFHILQGFFIYFFILIHTFSFTLYRYILFHKFDPIFTYLDICVLCKTSTDYFYTIGRIGFLFLTVAFLAGLFRFATAFLRANWWKFHLLNYLVFFITGLHAYFLGTDFGTKPFFYFAVFAYFIVLYIFLFKKLPELIKSFFGWVRS